MKTQTRKTLVTIITAFVLVLSTAFTSMAYTLDGEWETTTRDGLEYSRYKSSDGIFIRDEWIFEDWDHERYADSTGYMLRENYSVDGYWVTEDGLRDNNVKRKEENTGSLKIFKTSKAYKYSDGTGYSLSVKFKYYWRNKNNAIGTVNLIVTYADGTKVNNNFYLLPDNTTDRKSYGGYSLHTRDNFLESDATFYLNMSPDGETVLFSSEGYTTPLKYNGK